MILLVLIVSIRSGSGAITMVEREVVVILCFRLYHTSPFQIIFFSGSCEFDFVVTLT